MKGAGTTRYGYRDVWLYMVASSKRSIQGRLPVRDVIRDELRSLLGRVLPADAFDKVAFGVCSIGCL